MFAVNLKKQHGRYLYKTGDGRKFSEFRESIVLSSLQAAKKNSLNTFRDATDSVLEDQAVNLKSSKPNMPAWLKDDIVSSKHIAFARVKAEETCGKTSSGNGEGQRHHDNDIGFHAANILYKRFTQKLNNARCTSKAVFFDELGYLFVDWNTLGSCVEQSSLEMRWAVNDKASKAVYFNDVPDSFPICTTGKETKLEENHVSAINKSNKRLL